MSMFERAMNWAALWVLLALQSITHEWRFLIASLGPAIVQVAYFIGDWRSEGGENG